MPCVFKNLAFKGNSTNYTHISLHANDAFYIYAKTVNHCFFLHTRRPQATKNGQFEKVCI